MNYVCKDSPDEFDELTTSQQIDLLAWISNIDPIKSFNIRHTSYGLKHIFSSSENGFYITNGQFKGAMIKAGFNVKDPTKQNWIFNISEKSIKLLSKENYLVILISKHSHFS